MSQENHDILTYPKMLVFHLIGRPICFGKLMVRQFVIDYKFSHSTTCLSTFLISLSQFLLLMDLFSYRMKGINLELANLK